MEKANIHDPESFDAKAATWDSDSKKVALANAIVEKLLETLDFSGKHVLDYGCATGLIATALARHARQVTAVDTSVEMVRMLLEKQQALGLENLQCWTLPEHREHGTPPYDIIVTSMVLHHIEDIPGQLTQFNGWLAEGGRLLVVDLEPEDGSFHAEGAAVHAGFDPALLAEQVTACGFQVEHADHSLTFNRPNQRGEEQAYGLFLLIAEKPEDGQ